jgi:predicted MPP superfamily phosphohydrolase
MKSIKKLKIWGAIALLILLTLWLKWDNWFYNPKEPIYQTNTSPSRILITCSGDFSTTRDITWQSDPESLKGSIQYLDLSKPSDTTIMNVDGLTIKTSGGSSAYFKIKLKNLTPGSTYKYRVSNKSNHSEWAEFKIAPLTDHSYSFIYLGDVQDSINGQSSTLFQKAFDSQKEAAFIMFVGDMIERPHDAYWGEWFRAGGDRFRTTPVIATPGNHEYYKGIVQKLDERWTSHFSFPTNGPENFLGRAYYWDYQNTRFISIDTNGIQSISSALEQRSWIKKVLETNHQKWTIVFMHHPLYSTSRGRDYFYLRTLFKSLFDKYNVDLVLAGHDHAYGRASSIPNSENTGKQGPIYIVAHASPKVYDIDFSNKMDKLASNTATFQLLNVFKDSLKLSAFTAKGVYFDGFKLQKDSTGAKKVTIYTTKSDPQYLSPTKSYLQKSSKKEIEKYNQEMQQWISKKNP